MVQIREQSLATALTAEAGFAITAERTGRVERFEPGEMSRTIYVPLTNDSFPESTKSFNVYLGNGESAQDAPLSGMRIDIVDDD